MKKPKKLPLYRRKIVIIPFIIFGLLFITAIAFRVSPAPGAAVIRFVFDKDAISKREAMEEVPGTPEGITIHSDIAYRKGDKDALLDVYAPSNIPADTKLPVVIWTHGGAWLSGDKTDTVPYFKRLADQGYIVVSLDYTLAPSEKYPYQVHQLNDAHKFISENITQYRGDSSKIVLAGDSAGAQLSSQLAVIITNPSYAKDLNIKPSLTASQISALVLYCGIYKMEVLAEPHEHLSKIISWGNRITVWSYTGTRDTNDSSIRQMSAYYHATDQFPASFISGGNGDALTNVQSKPFAEKLQSLGVKVETKFYEADHSPVLNHENQFILDKDGLENFDTMTHYLKRKTQ